jgi:uncharacterized protein (DUF1778 family)
MSVGNPAKTAQLQIRVTDQQKNAIQEAAARAGMDMSTYVLSRVLTAPSVQFQECIAGCSREDSARFALAELNSLLTELTPGEMGDAVATGPSVALPPFLANYVAALVEYGCARCCVPAPTWTRSIRPLESPEFGSSLQSLRLHLLTHSPPPFRLRNIFIDSSLGQRV